jgi:two-component system OmpR family sensor kinase
MGRLFWKFFFSFWLTLLIAAITAGSVVWLKRAADTADTPEDLRLIDYKGIPYVMVAADIAEQQGLQALIDFIRQSQQDKLHTILAVDSNGQDLLQRPVDADTLEQARSLLERGKRRIVKQINVDTQSLLLFAPLAEPEPAKAHRHPHHPKPFPLLFLITSAVIASLLFSALLAWYFTRPIRTLKQAFQSVAEGKLDTRISPDMSRRRDELSELGINFNFMASQISALINGQRQLLHDVSHELRSPLARIQAAVGIAQQQPEKVAETLSRLEKETDRMSELVGELLLLSRLETGVAPNQPTDIDLNLLLDEIVADARFEAESKAVSIDYQHNGDVNLFGQQELLHRAVENVLRNAIKFSDEGDTVNVRTALRDHEFEIVISDQGPGVAEADLDQLFRPFFRGQQKRRDGIGLGLTIAQRAVTAHHGRIEARNLPDGGLSVTICLPV